MVQELGVGSCGNEHLQRMVLFMLTYFGVNRGHTLVLYVSTSACAETCTLLKQLFKSCGLS